MTGDQLEDLAALAARLPVDQVEDLAARLGQLAAARRWHQTARAADLLDRPALGWWRASLDVDRRLAADIARLRHIQIEEAA